VTYKKTEAHKMVGYGSLEETSPLLEQNHIERQSKKSPKWKAPTCFAPNGTFSRVTALLLMSLVGFGAFFCFDNPGALQTEVQYRYYNKYGGRHFTSPTMYCKCLET
jgi:hypothetical protein